VLHLQAVAIRFTYPRLKHDRNDHVEVSEMSKKSRETHLGTAGVMDHPQLYDSSTERMKPSDNILNEGGRTGEHRDADTIPSATQAPPNIFHQTLTV
jgi:hypothetical protein